MLYSQSIGDESLVSNPFWLPESVAKHTVQTVIAATKENIAI